MFTPHEVIDMAIRLEQNGEAIYRQAIHRVPDPDVADMLLWMADEEARHARWFAGLKDGLTDTGRLPFTEKINRVFLGDLLDGQGFSLKEVDFSAVATVGELARLLVGFEEDTIVFYEILQPFAVSADTRRQLEEIIAEERRHIERLETAAASRAALTTMPDPA